MWIAPVQVAAPALPGTAPATAPPGNAPPFDQALEASLVEEQEALAARGAVVPLSNQRALAAFLLAGAAAAPPDTVEATSSETDVEEAPDSAAEVEEGAGSQLDMSLVAPVMPQQPLTAQAVEIPAGGIESTPEVRTMQNGAGAQDATLVQDAASAAAEAAKTQRQADLAREAVAAEPQNSFRLPEATVPSDGTPDSDMAENRDAMLRAEPSAPQDRSAGPFPAQTVAGARFVAGAKAPALSGAAIADPGPTDSAAAAAAETAPIVQTPIQDVERGARDATAAAPRVTIPGAGVFARARMDAQTGGGDANSFEEDRRSPAGQRLAAALSAMAPATRGQDGGAGSASAPMFSVAQPATPVTPIATPVPVAAAAPVPTDVDAENVHSLVQAMRITAKAGGWEATVRLKPEHLGEVTIALRVDGKNVSAVVQADSAGVRQWLMSQEDAVRSGLSEHGLQLDRFAVSRDGQRREAEEQQPQEERRHRRAPRPTTGDEPRFEVVV